MNTRREFLQKVTVARTAGLVGVRPCRVTAEPPPETTEIESYQGPIPDEALLKYDAAVQSGLFSAFSVVTPAYFSQKQVDPWIVAQVDGAELYAVIAQWDDAEELGR